MIDTDTRKQIEAHLSVLAGLNLSGVGRAADMLTLQFGPIREMPTKRGTIKRVGQWSLHIQCGWKVELAYKTFADSSDFTVSEESIRATVAKMSELIANDGPFTVESIIADEDGSVVLTLSHHLRLTLVMDAAADEEDWRFFEPGSTGKHFVIQGGKVDPWSLS